MSASNQQNAIIPSQIEIEQTYKINIFFIYTYNETMLLALAYAMHFNTLITHNSWSLIMIELDAESLLRT